MDPLLRQISKFIKLIYVLVLLLVVYTAVLFYFTYYPPDPNRVAEIAKAEIVSWRPKAITDIPDTDKGKIIRQGYELILKTSEYIGPMADDASKRLAGNNLSCGNCHLAGGRKIGSGSFIGVANRFPQFRGRENKEGTLKERINGCMERSMSGKKLDEDSDEMNAMIAYMEWLSEDVPEDIEQLYKGYTSIELPEIKADTSIGHKLYELKCMICHGEKGLGQKMPGEIFTGYVYPPLGGQDTFNDGAGMNRVITAAEFIKSNMPFGATYDAPEVTDEEAYHIAAYINTFDRPSKAEKEADFPDKKLKPVSTPYGPWEDDFSAEQHKFGPFHPIMEYYQEKFGITKTK